jgi:predicted 2-oxoglutarate/Fe(II)-dependent dioxygenase YbiX
MTSIKDYIVVKNAIPEKVCKDIISNIEKDKPWEKHWWYDSVHDLKYTKKTKELDVLSITDELSKILNPIVNDAYKDYVNKFNGSGENTKNFINFFTPVRFNRYDVGTKMRKHFDFIQSIFDGQSRFFIPYKGIPILSLVGVLNDDYEGGEFVFNDNHTLKFSAGDILIFPSTFMYAHEVKEITKGKRYSFVSWGF